MTVIAGVSLFNGVMLLSDCRVTVQRHGKPDVHSDIAQKLFPLTQSAAIGFCGDVATAALLLGVLRRQLPKREHKDVANLLKWLPRLFRSSIATLKAKKKRVSQTDFMLAGIVPDRANMVERAKVVELMRDIASGKGGIQRSFIPDIVVQVMTTPPEQEYVVIGNSPAGVLCMMRYPLFEPQFLKPLEFAAIGSGQRSTVEIKKCADWLLAGMPGNDMVERCSLTDAVSQFIAENEIKDVGGMYPCVKIDRRGVGCLGIHQTFPLYEVSLTYDSARARWVQENHTTGKKLELLMPWEVMRNPSAAAQKFDDMREAAEHANPLRAHRTRRPSPGIS
jgi:hypothetical protein